MHKTQKVLLVIAATIALFFSNGIAWGQRSALVEQDSLGLTMYDIADYVQRYGPSATVDSAVAVGQQLINSYPDAIVRTKMTSLNATGQWLLCFDLSARTPYRPLGMTTSMSDSGSELVCTMTILPGRLYLDPHNDCFGRSILAHEFKHVDDFISGASTADALALFFDNAAIPLAEFLEMFEDEARAYKAQAEFAIRHGCSGQYPMTRAYAEGSEIVQRGALMTLYRADLRYPRYRRYLDWVASHPPDRPGSSCRLTSSDYKPTAEGGCMSPLPLPLYCASCGRIRMHAVHPEYFQCTQCGTRRHRTPTADVPEEVKPNEPQ